MNKFKLVFTIAIDIDLRIILTDYKVILTEEEHTVSIFIRLDSFWRCSHDDFHLLLFMKVVVCTIRSYFVWHLKFKPI